MADFREKIHRLQDNNTKNELIDILADRVGEAVTSVNPTTEAMVDRIAPEYEPIDFALKSENYSDDFQPVAKNALALKILLHQQVGRPMYDRILTLKKRDFAECIAAVDAHDEGSERGFGLHTPTTLPRDVDEFVNSPPNRTQTRDSLFDTIAEIEGEYDEQITCWCNQNPELADAPFYVYVLDCTPVVGERENQMVWDLRREVQTKMEAGIPITTLKPGERAAQALNESKRVYYVGSTSDVVQRVHEHDVGTAKSGVDFTTIISPKRLVDLQARDSRQRAKSTEGDRARDLNSQEGVFAYSDEM